jgi:DNA mismatch endonuclease (patch repair protein)
MDRVSQETRSRIMASIRGRDTKPEMAVRSLVHALGYRFRLHVRTLPGSPDLVLSRHRIAIFVHGCFWHLHACRAGRAAPKTRAAFWRAKREGNRDRDRRTIRALRRLGWSVIVVWECHLRDIDAVRARLAQLLVARSAITCSRPEEPASRRSRRSAEQPPARARNPRSGSPRRARSA